MQSASALRARDSAGSISEVTNSSRRQGFTSTFVSRLRVLTREIPRQTETTSRRASPPRNGRQTEAVLCLRRGAIRLCPRSHPLPARSERVGPLSRRASGRKAVRPEAPAGRAGLQPGLIEGGPGDRASVDGGEKGGIVAGAQVPCERGVRD